MIDLQIRPSRDVLNQHLPEYLYYCTDRIEPATLDSVRRLQPHKDLVPGHQVVSPAFLPTTCKYLQALQGIYKLPTCSTHSLAIL
jgi:hypothetical protein